MVQSLALANPCFIPGKTALGTQNMVGQSPLIRRHANLTTRNYSFD